MVIPCRGIWWIDCIIGASILNISNPMMVMPLFAGIGMPFVVTYFKTVTEMVGDHSRGCHGFLDVCDVPDRHPSG